VIKQFVPQEVCLKCQGCCRFREENSAWAPCLLEEEIESLIDRADIPAAFLSLDKRIKPIKNPQGEGYLCAFFDPAQNKCRIYAARPFECQLYPFLIALREKKILLTVDLHCPYVQDKLKTAEFKDYVNYLTAYLNSPSQLRLLKDNPQILQAYEEVADLIELEANNETA
jgi:Fe-S-cluster containining protein